MSHEIDTMFSVRERPWHKHLTGDRTFVADEYPADWDEARRWGGILWEPRKVPTYASARILQRGEELPEGASFEIVAELPDGARVVQERVDEYSFVERDDTGARLAMVNSSLPLISHAQMGELATAFTEQWRKAGASVSFETVGGLKGGRFVWALVRLDEPFQVPGDDSATYPYGLLTNSHDGTGACKFMPTNVRVVCWNTLTAADMHADASGHQIVIRHVGDVETRIEQAKETLAAIRENAAAWQTEATELARIEVDEKMVATFLDDFIPMPPGASERMVASREQARQVFSKLYDSPYTGVPGNAYGLFQTATEYLDHFRRSQGPETYLTRTITPQREKLAALEKIRELVAVGA